MGVAGLPVALVVRRAADRGWERARLVPGPLRRHRQVDTVDVDGRFRFTLATAADLGPYDEVAVVPLADAGAVRFVNVGARGLPGTALRLLPPADAARWRLPPAGDVRLDGVALALRPEIGVPVRTATLARAFVRDLYAGAPPFPLPPVRVELDGGGSALFQAFDPDALGGAEIELSRARAASAATVAHEYGHYVSFQMWGSNALRYALRNKELREGWAIFFSFAARAYEAAQHGAADLATSNPERAPFADRLGARRYDGIAYGTTRPEYAAIGSLLWSLYDGADPSPFEPDGFGLAGDNDDVSGPGLAVFEAVRQSPASVLDEAGILEVVARFQAEAPARAASVDGAVSFFLCPARRDCDVKAPLGTSPRAGARTLRPVSPAALAATWRAEGGLLLTWERRVPVAPWANAPETYRVLYEGEPIAYVSGRASWVVLPTARPGVYAVEAVGAGGVAVGAPVVRVGPPPAR